MTYTEKVIESGGTATTSRASFYHLSTHEGGQGGIPYRVYIHIPGAEHKDKDLPTIPHTLIGYTSAGVAGDALPLSMDN